MKVLLVAEGPNELGGALETIVRRLGLTNAEITSDRVSRGDIHAHHGKGQGYFKRAVRWMMEAQKRGHDAIVLVIDEDGRTERSQELDKAQAYARTPIGRALGVAIKSFDAWMLADEKALATALGANIPRQPSPEDLNDPKSMCRTLLVQSADTLQLTEMYARIANWIELEQLSKRCQKGFAPFAIRIRELAVRLNQ